jgi:hypothetical protein
LPASPTDGVCACALAFSTLLSSQGADAHHRSALAGFRGNPSNLPASSGPVKSCAEDFDLACQLAPASAYLRFGTTRYRAPSRKPSCSLFAGPRGSARQRRSVSLGAGETLGSKAVSVKSGLPAPVTAGSPAADLHSKASSGRPGCLQGSASHPAQQKTGEKNSARLPPAWPPGAGVAGIGGRAHCWALTPGPGAVRQIDCASVCGAWPLSGKRPAEPKAPRCG